MKYKYYNDEERTAALELYSKQGNVQATARELNIPRGTLKE